MGVTGADRASHSPETDQIEKLVQSPILQGSESLCKLLRYLAHKSVSEPGIPVKEYQIATEVFGRSGNFDPRLDSTVRVQTGRLRSKLTEYYSSEGLADGVLVDIPKGAYTVTFERRDPSTLPKPEVTPSLVMESLVEGPVPQRTQTGWRPAALLLGGMLLAALAVIGWLEFSRPKMAAAAKMESPPEILRSFWRIFTEDPEEPLIVFSNAAFVGRPETGLRYFDPKRDAKALVLDHYTGVGEVLAIHELDRVFMLIGRGMRLKRGQLISLDDVKNNNVIFVGSPSENLTLREIPGTKDFVFRLLPDGPRRGDLAIYNLHPDAGQPPYYLASSEVQMLDDYALVALFPGINPAHSVLLLAGTSTMGTQAAVEYVCHTDTLEALRRHLKVQKLGSPFEAVLHVTIRRGVPVSSELVATRAMRE